MNISSTEQSGLIYMDMYVHTRNTGVLCVCVCVCVRVCVRDMCVCVCVYLPVSEVRRDNCLTQDIQSQIPAGRQHTE